NADAGDMPVLGQLPQMACRDTQRLCCFTGPQGQEERKVSRNHNRCSSGSLAAQRGLHTHWRSVRQKAAEQLARREESLRMVRGCDERKFFQVFGISCRTMEH